MKLEGYEIKEIKTSYLEKWRNRNRGADIIFLTLGTLVAIAAIVGSIVGINIYNNDGDASILLYALLMGTFVSLIFIPMGLHYKKLFAAVDAELAERPIREKKERESVFHISFYNECKKNNITNLDSAADKQRAFILGNQMNVFKVTEQNVDDYFNRGKSCVDNETAKQKKAEIDKLRNEQRNIISEYINKYRNLYGRDKRINAIAEELDALRRRQNALQNLAGGLIDSAYKEQEHDWGTIGGIASAIGGVGAGIAAASQAQRENEEIRARNAANQSVAKSHATTLIKSSMELDDKIKDLENALQKATIALVDENLTSDQLFNKLGISCTTTSDNIGVVTIETYINSKEDLKIFETVSATIDGVLKADIIINGKSVANTLLALPFEGVYKHTTVIGKVVIPYDDRNKNISVTFSPHSLWAIERVS